MCLRPGRSASDPDRTGLFLATVLTQLPSSTHSKAWRLILALSLETAVAVEQAPGQVGDLWIGVLYPLRNDGREAFRSLRQLPEQPEHHPPVLRSGDITLTADELGEKLARHPAEDGFGLALPIISLV